jgi:hypothetical protein
VEVFDPASKWGSLNIDECTTFYKMPMELNRDHASMGSITAVHACVVPDTPLIPW